MADPTFRSEQVSDVITTTCEHFMPWAVGVVVRWLNDLREAEAGADETVMGFCPELPMCIRHGVSSREAVWLARQGVARDVAIRMADSFNARGEADLRIWLRELGIEGWVELGSLSPTDLRALIQFSCAWDAGIAGRVLEGVAAVVPVEPVPGLFTAGPCALAFRELPHQGTRAVVERNGEIVAYVAVDHIAEVEALLATGIPLVVHVGPGAEVNAVEITLGGDDDAAA